MAFKLKISLLKLFSFCLLVAFFLLFYPSVFAEEVVLNLSSKIYHKVNGQHSLYCSDCVVTERNKAEALFAAKPCKVCVPHEKKHKKIKKSHKRSHKHKKKKIKHRKPKKHRHHSKRKKQI